MVLERGKKQTLRKMKKKSVVFLTIIKFEPESVFTCLYGILQNILLTLV